MSEGAWFLVRCDMHKHEKMAALPNDAARLGWYVVLAEAKVQKKQGTFASELHFKAVVGRFARYLPDYIKAALIEREADRLVVHDWQRHQWAGKKAGQREDNGGTNEGQEEDLHAGAPAVPVPVNVKQPTSGEKGSGEEGADALDAYYRLTGSWPSQKVRPWITQLIDTHGDLAVIQALGAESIADSTRNTLLGRVSDRLEREAHEAEKRRQSAATKAAEEERQKLASIPPEVLEANKDRVHQMMVEAGLVTSKPKEAA